MSFRTLSVFLILPLVGCVAYQRDDADVQSVAAEVSRRSGGTYSFDEAAELALRQNPELLAAEARARAAGAATTVPLPVTGEWRGRNEAIGAMLDPIALLGLGPRGAEIGAAHARAALAATELAVQRWQTLAEVAEAFCLHRVADDLSAPDLGDGAIDAQAFERAGLASPVAAAMLRAAASKAHSERVELDRLRDDQEARLRHLLGLPTTAQLKLRHGAEPLVATAGRDQDLLALPDLAVAAARFEVADRDFRKAVAAQYPSFQLGPNLSLRGDPLRAMAMLNVPLGMHGLAAAAQERRQAARHGIEDALLEARRQADLADSARQAARANHVTAQAMLDARRTAFSAARAALDVQPDAFQRYATAVSEYVRAAAEHRNATTARAVADVRYAVAFGWPAAPAQEEAL